MDKVTTRTNGLVLVSLKSASILLPLASSNIQSFAHYKALLQS